ncbi:MAG: beta-ketoacyl-[acyl-carrier-protein] synthase family protein [Acidobacteriota bacterium]
MTTRRIAVSGIGCVSSLGVSREAVWEGLTSGRCGIGRPAQFDASGFRSQIAAEIPPIDWSVRLPGVRLTRWSRSDRLAVVATIEALADAGLDDTLDRTRVAVLLGAGTGDLRRNQRYLASFRGQDPAPARPRDIFHHFSNTNVDVVAEHFGFRGLRSCVVAACSSSTIAIAYGTDLIRRGRADVVVSGGSDVLCAVTVGGFNALRLVDTEPCRPFDVSRAGMNLGEAAAILVLEDLSHARRRGAHVYAEIAGHGVACEAHHATSPEPDGATIGRAITVALAQAGLSVADVDHVNAHGTATPNNDAAEAEAFHRVFGARASRIPVTSIKSMVGHCLGAAGAIEAAALAMTIDRGIVPPTIHHERTDPACNLEIVANDARALRVRCGVSTSLAFGGNDSALVLTAVE